MPYSPVPPLAVTTSLMHGVSVLTVSGDIDLQTAPLLADHITTALNAHPTVLILDLGAVDFLASAGLELLMNTQSANAATLAVVAGHRAVRRPIILTGVDRVIPLYTSQENALAELSDPAGMPSTEHPQNPAS